MKTLVLGDLAATGFGTVTMDLGRAMLDRGEDLRFLSLNEAPGSLPEPFESRAIRPDDIADWSGTQIEFANPLEQTEKIIERLRSIFTDGHNGWQPDNALIIGDPASVILSGALQFVPDGFPTYHYVPIEGVGLPPSWMNIWTRFTPIAMCEFGASEIEKLTGTRPPFVYHGVDTSDFYPVSRERPIVIKTEQAPYLKVLRSRDECKAMLGFSPDTTILFRADRNMPRKRYGSMLRAVAPVLAAHKAVMLMHCRTIDNGGNLDDYRSFYPLSIAGRMITTGFHDVGIVVGRPLLNALYNAADLTLSTGAEGFGLTIAESLACGTPVVGMDFSSVPEVIGPAGVTVPVGYLVENIYAYAWAGIDEPAFTKAVDFLVTHKARRQELGRLGPRHVQSNFSWADAAARFGEIIGARELVAA